MSDQKHGCDHNANVSLPMIQRYISGGWSYAALSHGPHGWIRTSDLSLRRGTLYPKAELHEVAAIRATRSLSTLWMRIHWQHNLGTFIVGGRLFAVTLAIYTHIQRRAALDIAVLAAGFEPATSRLGGERSIHLS